MRDPLKPKLQTLVHTSIHMYVCIYVLLKACVLRKRYILYQAPVRKKEKKRKKHLSRIVTADACERPVEWRIKRIQVFTAQALRLSPMSIHTFLSLQCSQSQLSSCRAPHSVAVKRKSAASPTLSIRAHTKRLCIGNRGNRRATSDGPPKGKWKKKARSTTFVLPTS